MDKVYRIEKNQKDKEYNIILSFDLEETGDSYVIFEEGVDEDGNILVDATTYTIENGKAIIGREISEKQEIEVVEELLKVIEMTLNVDKDDRSFNEWLNMLKNQYDVLVENDRVKETSGICSILYIGLFRIKKNNQIKKVISFLDKMKKDGVEVKSNKSIAKQAIALGNYSVWKLLQTIN